MKDRDLNLTSPTPLRAAWGMASGLLAGAAVFGAAAWWIGQPPSAEPIVRAPALEAESDPSSAASKAIEAGAVEEARARAAAAAETPEPDGEPAAPEPVRLAIDDDRPDADHLEEAEVALEAGEVADAVRSLRRHLRHASPTFDVLLRLGRLARQVGELEVSTAALEAAVAMAPDDVEGVLQLARTHLEAARPEAAAAAARTATRLGPEEPLAWNLLGRAEMAASRWQRAEIALSRSVDLDPSNPHVYNHLGLLYIFMRRGTDAADALETSVALFGEDVPHYVLNNLGLAFELEGRLEAARGAFEEALAVSPFYTRARVNLRRLDAAVATRLDEAAKTVADGAGAAALAAGPEEAVEEFERGFEPDED